MTFIAARKLVALWLNKINNVRYKIDVTEAPSAQASDYLKVVSAYRPTLNSLYFLDGGTARAFFYGVIQLHGGCGFLEPVGMSGGEATTHYPRKVGR